MSKSPLNPQSNPPSNPFSSVPDPDAVEGVYDNTQGLNETGKPVVLEEENTPSQEDSEYIEVGPEKEPQYLEPARDSYYEVAADEGSQEPEYLQPTPLSQKTDSPEYDLGYDKEENIYEVIPTVLSQEYLQFLNKYKDKKVEGEFERELEQASNLFVEFEQNPCDSKEAEEENALNFFKALAEIENEKGGQGEVALAAAKKCDELNLAQKNATANVADKKNSSINEQSAPALPVSNQEDEGKGKKAAKDVSKITAISAAIATIAVVFYPAAILMAVAYALYRVFGKDGNKDKGDENKQKTFMQTVNGIVTSVTDQMKKKGADPELIERFEQDVQEKAKEEVISRQEPPLEKEEEYDEIRFVGQDSADLVGNLTEELNEVRIRLSMVEKSFREARKGRVEGLDAVYDFASGQEQGQGQGQGQGQEQEYDLASPNKEKKEEAPNAANWTKRFSSIKDSGKDEKGERSAKATQSGQNSGAAATR